MNAEVGIIPEVDQPSARWATTRDDAALRALARAVPMVGRVSYVLEREPSYFALTRLVGDEARVAVVDGADPGTLVAMAATSYLRVQVGGRPVRVWYAGDAKVHPRARRAGHLRRVAQLLGSEVDGRGFPFGFATVLAGNPLMGAVMDHATSLCFRRVATLRNSSLLVGVARRRPPAPVRPATEADLGAMAALWARAHAGRDLVPARGEADLGRLFGAFGAPATPGLSLDRVLVVQRQGRLTGFALPWDATPIKQIRLRRLSPGLGALRAVYNAAASVLGRPVFPPDGELLRFQYLALPCAETAADLAAVVAVAAERARAEGALYLDLALDRTDPLAPALDGWPATHIDLDLVEITTSPRPPALSSRRVHYFDVAFV